MPASIGYGKWWHTRQSANCIITRSMAVKIVWHRVESLPAMMKINGYKYISAINTSTLHVYQHKGAVGRRNGGRHTTFNIATMERFSNIKWKKEKYREGNTLDDWLLRNCWIRLHIKLRVLQPWVLTTRVLTKKGSYNKGLLTTRSLKTRVLTTGGLTITVSYNQGSSNLGFLQPGV